MIRRHFSSFLYLSFTLLASACLAWSADDFVRAVRHVVHYLVSPWIDPPLSALENAGRFGRNAARLLALDRTFREMEARGLVQILERRRLEAVEAENRRLLSLLSMRSLPRYDGLVARVWTREAGDWFHGFTVRRGSRDGVKAADPVVVLEGGRELLLGQVAEVFEKTSRVLLLTDPSSSVSVEVVRTKDLGAAEGLGGGRLALNYLYPDADILVGDEVVTAGLGQIFPSGILVGTVEGVGRSSQDDFRRAMVRPAARAGRVNEVVILRRRGGPS